MMLRSFFLIPIALGALAGCGLKGPLYLPDEKGQNPAQTDTQRKDRTRDSGAQSPSAPTNTSPTQPATPPPGN